MIRSISRDVAPTLEVGTEVPDDTFQRRARIKRGPQIAFALAQRRQQALLMDVFNVLEAALPRFLLADTRAHCSELLVHVLFACTQPREFFAQTLVRIARSYRVIQVDGFRARAPHQSFTLYCDQVFA